MTQILSVLTIATVFASLSIQIARFGSHSWRGGGAYGRDKYTCTCAQNMAENGGGLMREGGTLVGFYGTIIIMVLYELPETLVANKLSVYETYIAFY